LPFNTILPPDTNAVVVVLDTVGQLAFHSGLPTNTQSPAITCAPEAYVPPADLNHIVANSLAAENVPVPSTV
jgi:hypothetical protein